MQYNLRPKVRMPMMVVQTLPQVALMTIATVVTTSRSTNEPIQFNSIHFSFI